MRTPTQGAKEATTPPKSVPDSYPITVRGHVIRFPFSSPHGSQLAMMAKILEALMNGKDGLLECPTGTGKTVAALAASLAFVEAQREKMDETIGQGEQGCGVGNVSMHRVELGGAGRGDDVACAPVIDSCDPKKEASRKIDYGKLVSGITAQVENARASASNDVMCVKNEKSDEVCVVISDEEQELIENGSDSDFEPNNDGNNNRNIKKNDKGKAGTSSRFKRKKYLSLASRSKRMKRPVDARHNVVHNNNNDVRNDTNNIAANAPFAIHQQLRQESGAGVSKIFFTSRTHQQLGQAVRELRRIDYHPRITTLHSRDRSCINLTVLNNPLPTSVNERCAEALSEGSCSFIHRAFDLAALPWLRPSHEGGKWDVEDLKEIAETKIGGCAYFASRAMLPGADLVFAPYNFVCDPVLRETMDLPVDNAVIIIDEAHNLDAACRESGSMTLDDKVLHAARNELALVLVNDTESDDIDKKDLSMLMSTTSLRAAVFRYRLLLRCLSQWLVSVSTKRKEDTVIRGEDLRDVFQASGFDALAADRWQAWARLIRSASLKRNTSNDDNDHGIFNQNDDNCNTQNRMQHTQIACDTTFVSSDEEFLYNNDDNYNAGDATTTAAAAADEGVVLLTRRKRASKKDSVNNRRDDTKKHLSAGTIRLIFQLSFLGDFIVKHPRHWKCLRLGPDCSDPLRVLCLSPGPVFHSLRKRVRSIIITSGTLSPLSQFSIEFEADFPIQLRARHPADVRNQLLLSCVTHGPVRTHGKFISNSIAGAQSSCPLRLTMSGISDNRVVDSLGETVISVCAASPGGVIVFFPSYSAMDKITERWMAPPGAGSRSASCEDISNMYGDDIVNAPMNCNAGGAGISILDRLGAIKSVVIEPRDSASSVSTLARFRRFARQGRGAALLAVARGKVSEGADFDHMECCTVIICGIPFPNVGSIEVKLKMEHADAEQRRRRKLHNDNNNDSNNISSNNNNNNNNNKIIVGGGGGDWFEIQAFRAVSQAMGRILRHRNDFGAVVLADERYSQPRFFGMIPSWMQAARRPFKSTSVLSGEISRFFKGKGKKGKDKQKQ